MAVQPFLPVVDGLALGSWLLDVWECRGVEGSAGQYGMKYGMTYAMKYVQYA